MVSQNNSRPLRELIHEARQHEQRTHAFRHYLTAMTPRLHRAIQLPEAAPEETLLEFVVRYLENVPDFLEALTHCMQTAGVYAHGKIFTDIAREFFAGEPEAQASLHALLDKAYLAHRLIEEVNDRLLMLCGVPLAPMDMTMSNIVIHELLGEEFANQLDMAVHYAVETLFNPEGMADKQRLEEFLSQHQAGQWRERLTDWPCFAQDCAISLLLDDALPSSVH